MEFIWISVWNECVITLRQIHLLVRDTFVNLECFKRAYKSARMPVQSSAFVVTWMQHALACALVYVQGLRSCAYERVQLLHVSESKDKHRLSACLPAAPVIDVDGNTQTAAEELVTHERQTKWLAISFDGQITKSRGVWLSPIDLFVHLISV